VLLTRTTSPTAFVAHLLPAGVNAANPDALPPGARPLRVHVDVDGALWVTAPVPAQQQAAGAPGQAQGAGVGSSSRLDGAAAAADPAAAAAAALAQAGPMPTPLAPLGGCDRKFVPPSPQKPPDFAAAAAAAEGLAPDADARRALLGVGLLRGGGSSQQNLSQGGGGGMSQPNLSQSQPLSPDGGGAGPGARAAAAAAGSLHRLPPSARASPVAIKPSPFKERVDAATAAVVRKQRSLFQGPGAGAGAAPAAAAPSSATAEAAAAAAKLAAARDRGIGGIPGSQEVPDV
jgi:hypothetical protein